SAITTETAIPAALAFSIAVATILFAPAWVRRLVFATYMILLRYDLARPTASHQRSLFGSPAFRRFPFRPPGAVVRSGRHNTVIFARTAAREPCVRVAYSPGPFRWLRSPAAGLPASNVAPLPLRSARICRSGAAQIAGLYVESA